MKRFIPFVKSDPVVPVIRLQGMIASMARGTALNDTGLAPLIEKAFSKGKPAAVALTINSPGGSPAQSSLIAARIRRLADEKKIKVYAFVEDVAASGGYWLATAADEIWVDQNSVVGSIGVISAGFGFHEFISRHGVERRLYTAGKSKSMLDPFQPEKPEDVARLKEIQGQIHDTFIDHVKTRRGARLAEEDLFTGEIWVGQAAVDKGLADGIGHVVPKMKEVFGDKVRLVPFQQRRPLLARFGASLGDDLLGLVEEHAARARFGL
ncbi:S49 family peptidase [Ovoidimarina sediminis]|uniref:S49 family peptidase n=1 Tax=Ovoidimarina sediminis TaxID=3079856 RepID=UPI002913AF87|nr:S49 family peptidase [Rhodophyticola sp. MJ-SS7]MDU8944026.1 S49 family peptidase [Rhodophyticola sp. MJ-SS7]